VQIDVKGVSSVLKDDWYGRRSTMVVPYSSTESVNTIPLKREGEKDTLLYFRQVRAGGCPMVPRAIKCIPGILQPHAPYSNLFTSSSDFCCSDTPSAC
jgi:hypothetical protein